jgi:hypothetical protein
LAALAEQRPQVPERERHAAAEHGEMLTVISVRCQLR